MLLISVPYKPLLVWLGAIAFKLQQVPEMDNLWGHKADNTRCPMYNRVNPIQTETG